MNTKIGTRISVAVERVGAPYGAWRSSNKWAWRCERMVLAVYRDGKRFVAASSAKMATWNSGNLSSRGAAIKARFEAEIAGLGRKQLVANCLAYRTRSGHRAPGWRL